MRPSKTLEESSVVTLDDVNRDALWTLIVHGSCPLPQSIIPPSRSYPLWKTLPPRTVSMFSDDVFGRFLYEAKYAVERALPRDRQRIGVWLSGGVDSSTLLEALLQCEGYDITAYYLSFGVANNELDAAERVTDHLDVDLVTKELSVDEAIRTIPESIELQRAPIDALAVRPLAKLCAQDGVDHCFSALGMDELTGGYPAHVHATDKDYPLVEDAQLWRCQSYFVWINQTHSRDYVTLHFPFLDPHLVHYARNLPRSHKTRGNDTKVRLREELLRFTDLPYENVMAGRDVGTKGGFTPYLEDWWHRGLGDWCDDNFPSDYFHLLDQAKLKLASTYRREQLNLWVRLRCATTKIFLDMVQDGVFTV